MKITLATRDGRHLALAIEDPTTVAYLDALPPRARVGLLHRAPAKNYLLYVVKPSLAHESWPLVQVWPVERLDGEPESGTVLAVETEVPA